MFNALNGIRALVDEDPEQPSAPSRQLSAILRNAMSTVKRRTVPLGEELDIVRSYLALEHMRYEERLRVRYELDAELDREPVPPMLLQTLVENAVKHGVAHDPKAATLSSAAQRGLKRWCSLCATAGMSRGQGQWHGNRPAQYTAKARTHIRRKGFHSHREP
ncbi:MAG: histidine kinase [Flavobacteriales bacterium]|nr:histidine kinase [Flavobacteriales bacterium]